MSVYTDILHLKLTNEEQKMNIEFEYAKSGIDKASMKYVARFRYNNGCVFADTKFGGTEEFEDLLSQLKLAVKDLECILEKNK